MVKSAPYKEYKDQEYDPWFEKTIKSAKKGMHTGGEDDFFIIGAGTRGTGKSTLMLHGYELYDPEGCSVDYIGLNRSQHAKALGLAIEDDKPRFCCFDEANVSGREHMTEYNRDLISTYYSIRGAQIFHWWNNPSLDIIDKPLIEDMIKGFIFFDDKAVDRPRRYLYFRKKDLIDFYEDNRKELTISKLSQEAEDYAYYRGWFKKYTGRLWDSYSELKEERMKDKGKEFARKYGADDLYSQNEVSKIIGCSDRTVRKHAKKLVAEGELEWGEDVMNVGNSRRFNDKAVELISERYAENNRVKSLAEM